MHAIAAVNLWISVFLNSHVQQGIIRSVVYFIAVEIDVWVALMGFAYLFFGSHQEALFSIDRVRSRFFEALRAATSVVAVWVTSGVIKMLAHLPRPYVAHPEIKALFTLSPHASFPSGHATLFFALAFAIYRYHKKTGMIFFIFAVLISVARVAAGVHYAFDVLGGAVLGIIGTWAIEHALDYAPRTLFSQKRAKNTLT